jgi:hypothetical protein
MTDFVHERRNTFRSGGKSRTNPDEAVDTNITGIPNIFATAELTQKFGGLPSKIGGKLDKVGGKFALLKKPLLPNVNRYFLSVA